MIYFQKQVDEIIRAKDQVIDRLEKELAVQTSRANNAVDRLLTQESIRPITPDTRKDVEKEKFRSQITKVFQMGRDVEGKSENGK